MWCAIFLFLSRMGGNYKEGWGVFATVKPNGQARRGGYGNVARKGTKSGPFCHIVGAEVGTSVNFPNLPRRWDRDSGENVKND